MEGVAEDGRLAVRRVDSGERALLSGVCVFGHGARAFCERTTTRELTVFLSRGSQAKRLACGCRRRCAQNRRGDNED